MNIERIIADLTNSYMQSNTVIADSFNAGITKAIDLLKQYHIEDVLDGKD